MGFRKDVRKFMETIRLDMTKKNTVVEEQARMILVLREQNKELFDRFMARDFPELQTYSPTQYSGTDGVTMDFEHDESNAGEVIDPEGEEIE